MQNVRNIRIASEPLDPAEPDGVEEFDAYDTFEMYRVVCPDCDRPIALLTDEDILPEHALCPTPWNHLN